MKILITGGAGFIGSNVADSYIKEGHDVIVVDNLSTGKRENVNTACKFYEVDITSPDFASIIVNEKPDVINHHAAQIDVRSSVEDPAFDAKVNIMGMINACQAGVRAKVKKVIFASSGGVLYGEVGWAPADEDAQIAPLSPYGVSKYASEMYLRYFNTQHGLDYTCLRYGNVYGPRQQGGEAGVVSIFIDAMLHGKQTIIFGDGLQERDFVCVADVAKANVAALNKGSNQAINIGTGEAVSVNHMHEVLAGIIGYKTRPNHVSARAGELNRSVLSFSKAKSLLGWSPEISLDDGLKFTVDWFKSNKR